MLKHKVLALALVLVCAITSCKDDAGCSEGEEGWYLTSEWSTAVATGDYIPGNPVDSVLIHTVYSYDENRHLRRTDQTFTNDDSTRYELYSEFQRDACGNVVREDAPYSLPGFQYRTFSYNDDGQCIAIHHVYDGDTFDDSITYTTNRIAITRYRDGRFANMYSHFVIDSFTRNITFSTHQVSPALTYSELYYYDDKPNPRKKMLLPPSDNLAYDYSTNNVLLIRGINDTIPYTYNAQGYPATLGNKTFHYQKL